MFFCNRVDLRGQGGDSLIAVLRSSFASPPVRGPTATGGLRHEEAKLAVRPAGQPSQFRAISAMIALKKYQETNFENLEGLWVSKLILPGKVYFERASGHFFLCLQQEGRCALAWQIREVSKGLFEISADSGAESRSHVHFICTHVVAPKGHEEQEEYAAVPVKCSFLSAMCP